MKKLKIINPYGYQKRISKTPMFEQKANEILKNINYELINTGVNGDIIYFEIEYPIKIQNILLNKGKYLLKIQKPMLTKKDQSELLILSEKNLIPKIYFVNWYLIIQDFVDGIDLRKFYLNKNFTPAIKKFLFNEINREYEKWNPVSHGDLKFSNILLTNKGKIYLIDPLVGFGRSDDFKREQDLDFLKNFQKWYNGKTFDDWIFL